MLSSRIYNLLALEFSSMVEEEVDIVYNKKCVQNNAAGIILSTKFLPRDFCRVNSFLRN